MEKQTEKAPLALTEGEVDGMTRALAELGMIAALVSHTIRTMDVADLQSAPPAIQPMLGGMALLLAMAKRAEDAWDAILTAQAGAGGATGTLSAHLADLMRKAGPQ